MRVCIAFWGLGYGVESWCFFNIGKLVNVSFINWQKSKILIIALIYVYDDGGVACKGGGVSPVVWYCNVFVVLFCDTLITS